MARRPPYRRFVHRHRRRCPSRLAETALVVFILYLVLRKKPKKPLELTPKDVDELIAEWRPQPLVPALTREEKLLLERETVVESFVSSTQLKVTLRRG